MTARRRAESGIEMIRGEKVVGEKYTRDGRVAVAVERFGLVYWTADLGRTWQRSAEKALSMAHGAATVAA